MRTGRFRIHKEQWVPAAVPLLFAVVLLVISPLHDTFEEWDGVVQAFAGREIVSGEGYPWGVAQRWPPLYPLLIGLGGRLLSEFDAAKWISMTAAVGLVYVVYTLTVEMSGRRTLGLLAQGFLVVNPRFVISSIQVENHMLESVFLVCALTLFLKSIKSPGSKLWLAVGATAGLAALTRYTSYALLPVFALVPFAFFGRRQALRAALRSTCPGGTPMRVRTARPLRTRFTYQWAGMCCPMGLPINGGGIRTQTSIASSTSSERIPALT